MSAESVARRYFDLQGEGDVEGAVKLFAPDAKFFGPMGEIPVPDGVRQYLQGFAGSFPGNRFEITNVIAAADEAAVEGYWIGTHTGTLTLPDGTQIPATNKQIRDPFAAFLRMRGEQIVEHRGHWDMAGFMAQLTA